MAIGDLDLPRSDHRTHVVTCRRTLGQGAHPLRQPGHELVVDLSYHVYPLDGDADLPCVEQTAPRDPLHRTSKVGVLQHYRRILTAQLQAHRLQVLGAADRDRTPGGCRAGELHEVSGVHHRRTRFAGTHNMGQDRRGADLVPALDDPRTRQWRLLRGLRQDRASGSQRGRCIHEEEGDREVPGRDEPDNRIWVVGLGQPLRQTQQTRGPDLLASEKPLGVVSVVGDEFARRGRLHEGIWAHLARFGLQQIGELVGVSQDPVPPAMQPSGALPRASLDPPDLGAAEVSRDTVHGLAIIHRDGCDQPAIGWVAHVQGVRCGRRAHRSSRGEWNPPEIPSGWVRLVGVSVKASAITSARLNINGP